MKLFVLVVLLVTLLAMPAFAYDWVVNSGNGHKYAVVQVPLEASSWNSLESLAVSLGGHLVSMNDENENQWVLENVIDPFAYSTQEVAAWAMAIGLYQLSGSIEPWGGWVWSSGEDIDFFNWLPNQPENYGGMQTIAVITSTRYLDYWGVSSGKWDDQPESAPSYGIVEIVPEPSSIFGLIAGLATLTTLKRRKKR